MSNNIALVRTEGASEQKAEDPTEGQSDLKPIDLARLQKEGIPPIEWLAEPYLVEGEIHLLIGDGCTGKTFLALDTALGLAAGQEILVGCRVDRPYRVLYLDEDGSARQVARRALRLGKGRGIVFDQEFMDRFAIYSGEGFRLEASEGGNKLFAAIDKHKPEILVLDALRAFHTGNENDSQHMTAVLRHNLRSLMKSRGLTVLLLHHTSKESEESARQRKGSRNVSRASRGSTEIRNAVDTVLYIERKACIPILQIDKTRNLGEDEKPDPLGFKVFDGPDEMLRIVRTEVPQTIRNPKQTQAKADIKSVLATDSHEELSHVDLLERLPGLQKEEYSERTARKALKALEGSVLTTRKDGKHVYYRRAEEDNGNAAT